MSSSSNNNNNKVLISKQWFQYWSPYAFIHCRSFKFRLPTDYRYTAAAAATAALQPLPSSSSSFFFFWGKWCCVTRCAAACNHATRNKSHIAEREREERGSELSDTMLRPTGGKKTKKEIKTVLTISPFRAACRSVFSRKMTTEKWLHCKAKMYTHIRTVWLNSSIKLNGQCLLRPMWRMSRSS